MRTAWRRLTALLSAIVNWRYFKPAVFVGCAIPLVDLSYSLWVVLSGRNPDYLGADPGQELLHMAGKDALAILLITLSVTPFRRICSRTRRWPRCATGCTWPSPRAG